MKILYVSNLYGDNARGGAERVVEAEAHAMSAAGHEVVVVRGGRAAGTSFAVGAKGPRVVTVVAPNLYFYTDGHTQSFARRFAWHLIDMFNDQSAKQFARILADEKPDVVHTHNLMGLGFLIPAAIRKAKVRHVHTVHDVQLLHPSGLIQQGSRAGVAQWFYAGLMKMLMGSPEVVLFPSIFIRSLHEQKHFFPRSQRAVLVNPVPAAVPYLRQVPETSHFLFVGQIEAHKGVSLLLDAWEKAGLEISHGATLAIVGDGALLTEIKERAKHMVGVQVLGKKTGDDLHAEYDRAAFIVVPSLVIENQPTVILEAFSRGTPAIGVSTGGIPELIKDGANGILCLPHDVEALATALRRANDLLQRAELWTTMSRDCVSWAQRHSLDAHTTALLAIYVRT